jgi:hypothetical protein
VLVEDVEHLEAELNIQFLCDLRVFHQAEIDIVIAETAQVRNARSITKVEVKVGGWFDSSYVKQGLVRIKVALVLSRRIGSGQNAWYACRSKLAGDVAETRAEEEWNLKLKFQ